MTHCISNDIQFLCPAATTACDGLALRNFSIQHLFGTSFKDIKEAQEKLRNWRIDPTKHLRFDLHNLQNLITRLNTANRALVPPINILCQIFEELAKLVKSFMKLIRITKRKFQKKRKKLTMIKKEIRQNFRENILFRIILITRLPELQNTVH